MLNNVQGNPYLPNIQLHRLTNELFLSAGPTRQCVCHLSRCITLSLLDATERCSPVHCDLPPDRLRHH